MATTRFTPGNRKVFTPVSSALGALSNGAGTIIVLAKQSSSGGNDLAGLTNSAASSWFHALGIQSSGQNNNLWDDVNDGGNQIESTSSFSDTTNWLFYAVDWSGVSGQTQRFHWRNQTGSGAGSPGAWSHENSTQTSLGAKAGPGTGGWLRLGDFEDFDASGVDMAIVAIWAGTRFADGDYGDFRQTSHLAQHAKGAPTFLCQLTAATLVDLIAASTYSSANSSGTTLAGADPDNWTFDGLGSGATVTAVPADATGVSPVPAVSAGSSVTAPVADAAGDAPNALATAGAGTADFSTYPNGALTAPWTVWLAGSTPTVTGGKIPSVSGLLDAVYGATTPNADSLCEILFDTAATAPDDQNAGVGIRLGGAAGYALEMRLVGPGYRGILYRGFSTSPQIASGASAAWDVIEGIRITAIGSTIKGYFKISGAWTEVVSATDATYASAGSPGFWYGTLGAVGPSSVARMSWGDAPTVGDATVTAVPADATGDSPDPTVTASSNVTTPTADATSAAPAPTVNAGATVTAPVADGTGAAPAPTVSAGANVTAPPADATGTAPPANQIVSVEVTTGPASATAAAPVPTVSGSTAGTVTAVPADGTGAAPTPTVQAGATVIAVPADATGTAPAPAVQAGSNVTSPPADATGQAPVPTVTGSAAGEVATPPADGSGTVPAPVVSAGATITSGPADGTGGAAVPTVEGNTAATVTAPAATGTGDSPAPSTGGPTPAVGGRVNPRRSKRLRGQVSRDVEDDRPLVLRR